MPAATTTSLIHASLTDLETAAFRGQHSDSATTGPTGHVMPSEIRFPSMARGAAQHSTTWDICVPIAIAAVPAGVFALLGLVTDDLDKPGANPPPWVIVAMIALQTLGIIAMAIVILVRFESAFRQLALLTRGRPPVLRKLALMLSIICILLFDILVNVSTAFAGADSLLVAAVPAFLAYVVCRHVAFVGL